MRKICSERTSQEWTGFAEGLKAVYRLIEKVLEYVSKIVTAVIKEEITKYIFRRKSLCIGCEKQSISFDNFYGITG